MSQRRRIAARDDPGALYLIDSSIYVFRAWHTIRAGVTDRDGRPANAAVGFAQFLFQLMQRRKPALIACAFDESLATNARNEIYPQYKANRPPAPEDLKHQFRLCRQLVSALGLGNYASGRHEADDIIGTLAASAARAGVASVIVSADKDLCQFVGKNDAVWDYARDVWLDARGVEQRFGIRPRQLADLLAICGDKVDNIPGVPGVGQATAAKLLVKWGDLETLIDNIDKVAQMKFRGATRVAGLLQENIEQMRLARQLTGLIEVPGLQFDTAALAIQPDPDRLIETLTTLSFSASRIEQWLQHTKAVSTV